MSKSLQSDRWQLNQELKVKKVVGDGKGRRKNVLTPIRTTVSDALGQLKGPRLEFLDVRIPEKTANPAHVSKRCMGKKRRWWVSRLYKSR